MRKGSIKVDELGRARDSLAAAIKRRDNQKGRFDGELAKLAAFEQVVAKLQAEVQAAKEAVEAEQATGAVEEPPTDWRKKN